MIVVGVVPGAQAQTRKWSVELHGGGMLPTHPTGGRSALPGPGAPFTTAGIFGPPAPPVLVVSTSRQVSSWFFGDGAVLFDQAASAVSANPVAMTAPFAARIVALDPVLGRSLGELDPGGSIGMRISRTITPRFAAELSVDYSLSRVQLTEANRRSIEATRASFIPAFTGLITSNPGRVLTAVNSTAELDPGDAHQLLSTAVLVVNLMTKGRVVPYAAVGAGLMSFHGESPRVSLTGNYRFSNAAGAAFNETDTITVSDRRPNRAFAGILGGGVKYELAARWGVQLDVRVSLSRNSVSTELDARPAVVLGQTPAGRVTLNANPTLQFGNSANPVTGLGVTGLAPSSLSGPPIERFLTWSSSGTSIQTQMAGGIFWRF
jgi:hypothetical protein